VLVNALVGGGRDRSRSDARAGRKCTAIAEWHPMARVDWADWHPPVLCVSDDLPGSDTKCPIMTISSSWLRNGHEDFEVLTWTDQWLPSRVVPEIDSLEGIMYKKKLVLSYFRRSADQFHPPRVIRANALFF
jgi:hypothetical protein